MLSTVSLVNIYSSTQVQNFFLVIRILKIYSLSNFILCIYFLLYNIVLVLPYIDMNPPWVNMCSPSWTPLPPPSPSHPSGSSQYTIPKHPVSCIEPGLAIHFLYDILHISMPGWVTTAQLHSSHALVKWCLKFSKPGFSNTWTVTSRCSSWF